MVTLKKPVPAARQRAMGPEDVGLAVGFQNQGPPEVRRGIPADDVHSFWRKQSRSGQLLGHLKPIRVGHIFVELPVSEKLHSQYPPSSTCSRLG